MRQFLAATMFVFLGVLASPVRAADDGFTAYKAFSADFSFAGPGQNMSGKYYKSESKLRIDPEKVSGEKMAKAGQHNMMGMAMIIDYEAKTMTTLMPDKKMAMTMPMTSAFSQIPSSPMDRPNDLVSRKTIGKATIDGHPTNVEQVVVKDKEGKSHEIKMWSATDLKGFPVQIESQEKGREMKFNFKNVKLGDPDKSVFEAPAEYQKMDMSNMQQMRGMAQPQH